MRWRLGVWMGMLRWSFEGCESRFFNGRADSQFLEGFLVRVIFKAFGELASSFFVIPLCSVLMGMFFSGVVGCEGGVIRGVGNTEQNMR